MRVYTHCFGFQHKNANVCLCVSAVFRVDLFCSGKVDGEAVLTIQLNVTIQTNNYTVLNFKRRKMCYKSESSKTSASLQCLCAVCAAHFKLSPRLQELTPMPRSPCFPPLSTTACHVLTVSITNTTSTSCSKSSLPSPAKRSRPLCTCTSVKTFLRRCGWCQRSRRGAVKSPSLLARPGRVYAEVSISGMWWKLLLGRSRGASRSSEAFRRQEREDEKAFRDLQKLLRWRSGAPGGALNSFFNSTWVAKQFFCCRSESSNNPLT